MDPSEEKREKKKSTVKKRSFILPAALLLVLATAIGGIYVFLQSKSDPPLALPEPVIEEKITPAEPAVVESRIDSAVLPVPVEDDASVTTPEETPDVAEYASTDAFNTDLSTVPGSEKDSPGNTEKQTAINVINDIQQPKKATATTELKPEAVLTVCSEPAKRLYTFYKHLDQQPYIQAYKLQESSELHFEKLIEKLLANPPKVTRESDDLYTILRNTAHFFRISGKDNILMLKGILNSEKTSLEQILADYYFLITTPECNHNKYAKNINSDALYEYACFFLNTMGGRLYLFRRDSQSRMVVTYYAILLVDLANRQQNNRHGIALKPAINMLISEMEIGGNSMKGSEDYLDVLYDLKEAYQ